MPKAPWWWMGFTLALLGAPAPSAHCQAALQQAGEQPARAAEEPTTVTVTAPEPRYVAPTARDRIGRIWAPVTLDDQGPFRLVLDTGADRSAVLPRVAQVLGKTARPSAPVRLFGITGEATVSTVHIDTLEIGDFLLRSLDLPIVPDLFGGADGVLGTQGLNDLRIVIEFRHDRIEIRRAHGERAPPGFSVLPMTVAPGRGLIVGAKVGSVATRAIIDTGAEQTVGNLALRDRLRQRRAAPAHR